jgi:hypothetical protein
VHSPKPPTPSQLSHILTHPKKNIDSPKQGVMHRLFVKSKAILTGQLSLVFDEIRELKTAQPNPIASSPASDLAPVATDARVSLKVIGTDQNRCLIRISRQLAVVQEPDLNLSAMCAGRMTISGRFSDVCAELDRMERLGRYASASTPSSIAIGRSCT